MGLDAAVFLNVANFPSDFPRDKVKLDEATGELFFEDQRPPGIPRNFAIAKEINFGNVAAIGTLRQEVSRFLGDQSFIVRKVLYSGSHSGDIIGLTSLNNLEAELSKLEALGEGLPQEVVSFALDLRELVSEAMLQGNPIVFL